MNGSAARTPLAVVRGLYEAWNSGDVAGAAALLAPGVRWESFRASRPVEGPQGLEATLAGSSGGTWLMSAVTVDLLVGVGGHVIAFTQRGEGTAEAPRLEVWTLRDGKVVHYRGYAFGEGLEVLSETTGSRKLEALCRGMLAFNRGEADGWLAVLRGFLPGPRVDDVLILAESPGALVISAGTVHLVLGFEGDRVRDVSAHGTPEAAMSAAARGG
jgi:SnoaL-like domain